MSFWLEELLLALPLMMNIFCIAHIFLLIVKIVRFCTELFRDWE
jgi:hypothetical protein